MMCAAVFALGQDLGAKENQQKQFADVDSQLSAVKKDAKKVRCYSPKIQWPYRLPTAAFFEWQVKEDLFELDRRHRDSHSMMLDVKRINAAADLEVRKLAAEVNKIGVTRLRFSAGRCNQRA